MIWYHVTMEQAASIIAKSERIHVITGAGISAASGIPTFRGKSGLYGDVAPGEYTSVGWGSNPEPLWDAAIELNRGIACGATTPNVAHTTLAVLEQSALITILTQNVDGLHQDAGSSDVIEIHGSARFAVCSGPDCTERIDIAQSLQTGIELSMWCDCDGCNGVRRPDVVLFGEDLLTTKVDAMGEAFTDITTLLIIGTTALLPHVQNAIEASVKSPNSTIITINPEPAGFLQGISHIIIREAAEEALPALVN